MIHISRLIIQYCFLSGLMIIDLMKSSPDNGLWVMWTLLFSWLMGLQCFFPVRFSLLKFKENLCCSWLFSHSVSSFPLHALTSFIKHSGIPCGIKIADGHSGSDRQDLPLEDSNSTASLPWFQRPRERSALAEPKCCWKSHTPRTGCPCFLLCLTPPITLAYVAAICQ